MTTHTKAVVDARRKAQDAIVDANTALQMLQLEVATLERGDSVPLDDAHAAFDRMVNAVGTLKQRLEDE
jgi:exonuclease VII small subunit